MSKARGTKSGLARINEGAVRQRQPGACGDIVQECTSSGACYTAPACLVLWAGQALEEGCPAGVSMYTLDMLDMTG